MNISDIIASDVLSGKQVLVAEDNKANQLVLRKLLKKVGIEPVFANNGEEVLEQYKAEHARWELVFMDCEMPIMDGYTATEEIRKFEQENSLPRGKIVGLSAHALDQFREKAIGKGMDDYLTKPIDREVFYNALMDYLVGI
ncbi:MAG: response regulator [Endozoicomonas sp.]